MLSDTLEKLEKFAPVQNFKFGHSPLQIEFFQTAKQQGSEAWEYYQHILQLKGLNMALKEMQVELFELACQIRDANKFWPIWSFKKRQELLPRLFLKEESILRTIAEKEREVNYHIAIIERRYSQFKNCSEEEIFESEKEYWTTRIGRQLATSHLSRLLQVSEGELAALMSLPVDQQKEILSGLKTSLKNHTEFLGLN